MNEINVTHHKCAGKCPEFKGEQCSHCLIQHTDSDFIVGDIVILKDVQDDADLFEIGDITYNRETDSCLLLQKVTAESRPVYYEQIRHATSAEIQAGKRLATIQSMGDDAHIENHVSQLCITDSTNRMESLYIEKKKQVELLQTEVARLNSIVERQKAEMVVMQARIDELTAEMQDFIKLLQPISETKITTWICITSWSVSCIRMRWIWLSQPYSSIVKNQDFQKNTWMDTTELESVCIIRSWR